MRIKNFKALATNKEKAKILEIINAGFESVDPRAVMPKVVGYHRHTNSVSANRKSFDLFRGRIFVVGGGKAAGHMAEAFESIVGSKNIKDGLVTCVDTDYKTKVIKVKKASHPFPDRNGVMAVKKMLGFRDKYGINEKDLVVCLISGGASSLLPSPAAGLTLRDKHKTTRLLLESGADINEINTVRKHLSNIKGGMLAKWFDPTPVMTLIISDVIGNRLDAIGSGVSVSDPTTFRDARNILEKYNLLEAVSEGVRIRIIAGSEGNINETPKKLGNAYNFIIADNSTALSAMALKAKSLGFKPMIASSDIMGDPREIAEIQVREIKTGVYGKNNVILYAGETTPSLPEKHGQGGRNMHLAAEVAFKMAQEESLWAFASASTDGHDYLSDYAGAIVDNTTLEKAIRAKIDYDRYLDDFNTLKLFEKLGHNLIKTGATGTNVGDIMAYMYLKK